MTLSLRPYQRAAIEALYDYFAASSGNPLVVIPTAGGKSVVIAGFIREAIAAYAETRVLVLTHQRELISQNFMAMLRAWPEAPAGIYSAGLSRRDIRAQILFAGIQSIHRHARQVQRCDLVLIDEAHLLGRGDSGMYRSFLTQLNEINAGLLKVVGFTATPYRLDSGLLHEGKDRLFTDIAYEVPVLEMIQQGYLCPVVPKQTSTQLDVGGVGTRGGEFIAKDLEAAVDRDEVTRGAVAEIVQHGEGRGSWLVFCSGVAHEQSLSLLIDCELGDAHGIRDHLDRSAEIEFADDERPTARVAP
jgi:DNA repair protein RadD